MADQNFTHKLIKLEETYNLIKVSSIKLNNKIRELSKLKMRLNNITL
jgi:hypothetical protein